MQRGELIMYLSRIFVDWPYSKSAYTIHQALWRLFPGRENADRDFLFRVEREKTGHGVQLLMQSHSRPTVATNFVAINDLKEFDLQFQSEQRVKFLLKANPIKTISDEKGRKKENGHVKKVRVPLIKEEEQLVWLCRKMNGIAKIEDTRVSPGLPMYFRKNNQAGKIKPVNFEGLINIIDPVEFKLLIERGVGPAKGFGCGMLSIAPA